MLNQFSRTQLLLGESAMQELANKRVAVFGIGGVGGYACEALVRSGIGAFDLIDDDKVCLTNLNRQIIATRKTVGKYKTEVMKERMLEINPNVDVRIHNCFFLPENADEFPFDEYDYIIDAVDTVTAKISIIMKANELGIPVNYLNLTNLSSEESNKLSKSNSYLKKNQWGTPTTLFMVGDKVIDSIGQYVDKDTFVSFVKENIKVDVNE